MNSANVIELRPAPSPFGRYLDALASTISAEHDAAQLHAESAVQHAIECGKALIRAKAKLDRGFWLPWLTAHCPFSVATANRYMKLAKDAERDPHAVRNSIRHVHASGRPGATRKPKAQAALVPDRNAMLNEIKAKVCDYASAYGWDAARADLGTWIEAQAGD